MLWSIWFGFMVAPVFYLLFGWFAARDIADGAFPMPVTGIFVLLGLACATAGHVLPIRFLSRRDTGATPATSPPHARVQTWLIVRWACYEAAAVVGLVLLILSGRWWPALVGAALAMALLYGSRPVIDRDPGAAHGAEQP